MRRAPCAVMSMLACLLLLSGCMLSPSGGTKDLVINEHLLSYGPDVGTDQLVFKFASGDQDEIPHYGCCNGALTNPRISTNMVWSFARRGKDWYYVEAYTPADWAGVCRLRASGSEPAGPDIQYMTSCTTAAGD